MEAKHTPGPWIITAQPGYSERWVEAPGVDVAEVRSGDADARLIAAAPALLAALEWALGELPDARNLALTDEYRAAYGVARAALAAATNGGAR